MAKANRRLHQHKRFENQERDCSQNKSKLNQKVEEGTE